MPNNNKKKVKEGKKEKKTYEKGTKTKYLYRKKKKEEIYITFCPLQLIVVVPIIKNDISCP